MLLLCLIFSCRLIPFCAGIRAIPLGHCITRRTFRCESPLCGHRCPAPEAACLIRVLCFHEPFADTCVSRPLGQIVCMCLR